MDGGMSAEADLGRLVERLGSTLLTIKAGPRQPGRAVTTVVLHDPLDRPDVPPDAVVLGVGVAVDDSLATLVRALGKAGATALVVREPVAIDEVVAREAETGNVSIFGLVQGASWIHVATLLSGALHVSTDGHPSVGGDADRDLFALANLLSALLDAPVTIEDLSSRVLAFSADQAGTDEPRRLTILGLQVPEIYSGYVREHGMFRLVYASDRPVFMQNPAPGVHPRVAMRVQAGDEILGSIWAAVAAPLTPEREATMIEAARVIALEMLRARVSADASQRLGVALLSTLIEGGAGALESAQQLGFGSSSACVLVFGPLQSDEEVRTAADIQRIASTLRTHLRPTYPRAVAAQLGGAVYAVVPVRAATPSAVEAVKDLAAEFIARLDTTTEFCAGLGCVVENVSELAASRRDADAALRVLRSNPRDGRRVASLADVLIESLLLRLSDLMAADRIELAGPLADLEDYDAKHGTDLLPTLQSWLEHFGDVAAAARAVHVHKNTLRYRLDRIQQIAGVDLTDPDERFGLMLQLRLGQRPNRTR
ncbi:PucR family transcriptional regulator [Streptomyces sp. NRRL F-5135]|uniref:PucR family transcriptional regulator n=1 Tax=Streptomyces sp. NRRL F-5135 TaxID=1463858 RepID=UPI00131BC055|nr:helix-turn-helix domain-containing protein [Streptomyces sp. NRRL F-5135]